MKYQITKKITKFNQTNLILKATGGIQHSTGNGEDTDEGNNKYFNTADREANAHAFIDSDSITQNVEWNKLAWHARRPGSLTNWGIEMCETKDPVKFQEIWNRAVWLWAYLFTRVSIPAITNITINTLRSHDEENRMYHKGNKNNHTDPTAYFAKFGKNMDMFRADVQKSINDYMALKADVMALVKKGIITDPKYWTENEEYTPEAVKQLIKNSGGLDALFEQKIITDKEYWSGNEFKTEYVRIIISRMAKA